MVIRPRSYSPNEITCEELDVIFQRDAALEHVVIVDGDRPCGILTRQHFYSVIGGRFGYSLFQKKPVDKIAKTEMLCLDEHLDLRTAGRLAMARQQEELYDPVISIDGHGRFIGTITMKQVINRAFDMEIKIATGANPLTQLPGNMIIGFWLEEAVDSPVFTVVYCDLDNFKAYNDAYGFPKGDDALRLTARTLNDFISLHAMEANLGHIGGDDFIIVSDTRIGGEKLQLLCDDFDERRRELFTAEDRERGWYKTVNRKGRAIKVPLVSMSLAVVTEANFTSAVHPGQLGQVAALIKKEIKARNLERGASGFLVDRRVYS
jgi:GGDEF domain-containing protein